MTPKSIAAVLAGVGMNMLAIPVDAAAQTMGIFSGPDVAEGPYALALAYRLAFACAGGWLTARLAPSAPHTHGLVLGILGVLFASLGVIAQWQAGHHWYPVSLAVLSLPMTWLGVRIFTRSRS